MPDREAKMREMLIELAVLANKIFLLSNQPGGDLFRKEQARAKLFLVETALGSDDRSENGEP